MNGRTDSIVELLNSRRPSHTSHVLDDPTAEQQSADEYTPFALGRVGNRAQMMLVLKKCTGEVTAYAYSLLTKVHSVDPSKGFTLTFGDTKIQIDGDNLSQLFTYVCQHKASEIVEADRTGAFTLNRAETGIVSVIRLNVGT